MRLKTIALIWCVAKLAALPQQPEQVHDQLVIRVNTRLVQLDVVVRDKNGPVAALRRDDFTVLDNGKPQKVSTFSVKSARRTPVQSSPLPRGTFANRLNTRGEEPETATVILWDVLNTEWKDQSYVRDQVVKYLRTLKRGDPVALYLLVKGVSVVQDFTDDPDRLIEAVARTQPAQSANLSAPDLASLASQIFNTVMAALVGRDRMLEIQNTAENAAAEMTDHALKDRAFITMDSLEAIAAHLSGLSGRKKLVWVSGSFPASTLNTRSRLNSPQIEIQDFGPEVNTAVRTLNNANVAVYPIDPRGLVAGINMSGPALNTPQVVNGNGTADAGIGGLMVEGINTMNLLANGTGGRAYYGTNDLVGSIQSALEDDEITYVLGFYPSDQKLDGTYHELTVKVARKGLDVRHRKGYYSSDTKIVSNGLWREKLNASMQNPLESTAVGLRASAAPVDDQPGTYSLEVIVDLSDVHLERRKDRWVALIGYGTLFSPMESARGTLETIQVSLTEDRLKQALIEGYVFRRMVVVGDLKGELRIAVEDLATGAGGTVRVPVGGK